MPPLRVLSVDVHELTGGPSALADLIERTTPHVVCVHGAPSLLRWRSKCAALARQVGMVVVGGGRTGGGNLILSTLGVEVDSSRDLAFVGTRGARRPGASVAALRLLGSGFVLAGARLDGNDPQRADQAARLNRAAAGGDTPVIMSVDGVAGPESAEWIALAHRRTALAGGVFADRRIAVRETTEIGSSPTRQPVLVELDLA